MTKVFGASDDLIEFEGELSGETYSGEAEEDYPLGTLVAFSDGTVLAVRYGKPTGGIWAIDVLNQGSLYDSKTVCDNEDNDPYSDAVFFKAGKLKAWVGRNAEVVK